MFLLLFYAATELMPNGGNSVQCSFSTTKFAHGGHGPHEIGSLHTVKSQEYTPLSSHFFFCFVLFSLGFVFFLGGGVGVFSSFFFFFFFFCFSVFQCSWFSLSFCLISPFTPILIFIH